MGRGMWLGEARSGVMVSMMIAFAPFVAVGDETGRARYIETWAAHTLAH